MKKQNNVERLDFLENAIYQKSHRALNSLSIDLQNLAETRKIPPNKIKNITLEDAAKLKKFYEDCNISSDSSHRARLRFLASKVSCLGFSNEVYDSYFIDFMDKNLVKHLREYDQIVNGYVCKKKSKKK